LAGPVVAAAVVLPRDFDPEGIADSKALSPASRDESFRRIVCQAEAVGVGIVGPAEIDEINILRATHKAMRAALDELGAAFDCVLVDGLPVPGLPKPSLAIVKGDAKCLSIMAASVVAKVTRDRIMCELDLEYPEYGFACHKGYCTKAHLAALQRYGPCPIHRRSFAPVSQRPPQCPLPGLE
jgi:ribonuclease HII